VQKPVDKLVKQGAKIAHYLLIVVHFLTVFAIEVNRSRWSM
jgi:hypothetical protein